MNIGKTSAENKCKATITKSLKDPITSPQAMAQGGAPWVLGPAGSELVKEMAADVQTWKCKFGENSFVYE